MMKTIGLALLASAGLTFAGDFYEGLEGGSDFPWNRSISGGSNFFIGGGVEYFFDNEQEFYSGHIGYDFGNSSVYVEAGCVCEDEFGIDLDIVPVTVNYKFEAPIASKLNFYVGGGIGVAFVEVEGFRRFSDDDQVFTAQAFAGLVYNVTEAFEIYGGVRYLWTDDVELAGLSGNFEDIALGGGLRINF